MSLGPTSLGVGSCNACSTRRFPVPAVSFSRSFIRAAQESKLIQLRNLLLLCLRTSSKGSVGGVTVEGVQPKETSRHVRRIRSATVADGPASRRKFAAGEPARMAITLLASSAVGDRRTSSPFQAPYRSRWWLKPSQEVNFDSRRVEEEMVHEV